MRATLLRQAFPLVLAAITLSGAPPLRAQNAATPLPLPTVVDNGDDLNWAGRVHALLIAENFGELDRMADEYRLTHARTKGGDFRLAMLYSALNAPRSSDQDTLDHLAHLRKWMTQRPESVTARLAMATSLHRWAWVARGNGFANTVSPEDADRFLNRHRDALAILKSTEKMGARDPQLYLQMMAVGVAEGWDKGTMTSLMERGLAIEPEYFYLQQNMANYLLPKWFGTLGASAEFAAAAANRLGGERGDQMYALIAEVLVKRGDGDFPIKQLDWQRIQHGFVSLGATYGETGHIRNELAFMAWRYQDATVAQAEFAMIGDRWSQSVWKDRKVYDKARDWSRGVEIRN